MDIDGNGMIDMEEFCLCMARHMNRNAKKPQQPPQGASTRSQTTSGRNGGSMKLSSKQLRDAFNYFDKVSTYRSQLLF